MKSLKPKKHLCLTIEELRSFKGYENISDEEAMETIVALEKFSVIMFELYQLKHSKQNEQHFNSSEICQRKAA